MSVKPEEIFLIKLYKPCLFLFSRISTVKYQNVRRERRDKILLARIRTK